VNGRRIAEILALTGQKQASNLPTLAALFMNDKQPAMKPTQDAGHVGLTEGLRRLKANPA
jgi:hypothetical protein